MRYFPDFRPHLSIAYILGLFAAGCADGRAEQTNDVDQPFSTALSGEAVHEEVTADGLYFLRPEIIAKLQVLNAATDVQFFYEARYHFDNCSFSQSSKTIAAEQSTAVQHLNPGNNTPQTTLLALQAFARSLHTAQDFYAHTNWVELTLPGLVDQSLGPWPVLAPYSILSPSNAVVVQGSPAPGTTVARDHAAPYPENTLVRVQRQGQLWPGLISGSVQYEPGDYCPPQVMMSHQELNKDRSTTAGRTLQHEQAKALAVSQTTHEWCRLVALTRAAWGDAGEQRLLTWLVAGALGPDCQAE